MTFAILGAGLIGLSLALELSRAGADVTLVERLPQPGLAASHAAAGMLAPSAEAQFGEDALVALGERSRDAYLAFVDRLSPHAPSPLDLSTSPTLLAAVDRDDAAQLRHALSLQQRLGLDVRWLRRAELLELEPSLSPRVVGGVLSPGDWRVDNRALIQALTHALRASRVDLRCGLDAQLLLDPTQKRCLGLLLPDGQRLLAEHTLIATGAWSGCLPSLPEHARPPVRPVKGQMLSVLCEGDLRLTHTIRTPRVYLVPRADGRVIVGATSEERGFDQRLTAGGLLHLLEHAYEVWPALYELPLHETWTGLRPGSRDNLPILGPSPHVAQLSFATGHHRNGVLLAPITAHLLTRALLHQDPDALRDLAPFSPARF